MPDSQPGSYALRPARAEDVPANRGRGLGRILLELAEAEARRAGFDSIYLYTHQKMTENQALYMKIGYVEYDRRVDEGLPRIYMRKRLQS